MGTVPLEATFPQSDPSLLQLSSFTSVQPDNSTLKIIDALVLQNSQEIRILVIVLSALNITAATAVVFSIIYDAVSAKKKNTPPGVRSQPVHLPIAIHPAEVFPFSLSIAVTIQGVIFIVVQKGGLQTEFVVGCRKTAQLIWPTLWVVTYTTLIFALETTIRSVRRSRFRARGKWDTFICLAAIIFAVTGTFLPALLIPAPDRCLATLIWWTEHYAKVAVVLGLSIIVLFLFSAAIITTQLLRTVKMDRDERIAATRVVYYLVLNVFTIALILPFYVQILLKRLALGTSHMADIVLNLSGFLTALIHLLFRSNAERLAIRPINTPWSEKRRFRFFGPNELSIPMVISTPLLLDRNDSRANIIPSELAATVEKSSIPRIKQIDDLYLKPSQSAHPVVPAQFPKTAQRRGQTKSTYSIFPTRASARQLSWSTTRSASPEVTALPQPFFARRHRRDDSDRTSETVQIGMRLSHAIYDNYSPSVEYQLPVQMMGTRLAVPYHGPHRSQSPNEESVQIQNRLVTPPPSKPLCSLQRTSPPISQQLNSPNEPRGLMKSLPPVPRFPGSQVSSGLWSHPPEVSAWPLASNSSESKESWI